MSSPSPSDRSEMQETLNALQGVTDEAGESTDFGLEWIAEPDAGTGRQSTDRLIPISSPEEEPQEKTPIHQLQVQTRSYIRKLGDAAMMGMAASGIMLLYICCGINAAFLQLKEWFTKKESEAHKS